MPGNGTFALNKVFSPRRSASPCDRFTRINIDGVILIEIYMDGYGMVRNMIATNRSNISRVGQRRSKKFESFDTSAIEYPFPEMKPVESQPVPQSYLNKLRLQQAELRKEARRKDWVAGIAATLLTSGLITAFYALSF